MLYVEKNGIRKERNEGNEKEEGANARDTRGTHTHTHTQGYLRKIRVLDIILIMVIIGMFCLQLKTENSQNEKIAKVEEPLKMQESITQTASLAQARTMAVAAADNNKYSTLAEVKTLLNSQMLSTYPVGSIYISTSSTNPGSLFGGIWVAWGSGRVPVGINTGDGNFNTVEKTGGEASHKLTVPEMPSHTHTGSGNTGTGYSSFMRVTTAIGLTGAANHEIGHGSGDYINMSNTNEFPGANHYHSFSFTTSGTGGNGDHNNLQPYITCYMWKRTA